MVGLPIPAVLTSTKCVWKLCCIIRKPPSCVYRYIRTFKIYLRICVYILRIFTAVCKKKIHPTNGWKLEKKINIHVEMPLLIS